MAYQRSKPAMADSTTKIQDGPAVSEALQGVVPVVTDVKELVQDVQAKDVVGSIEAGIKTATDVATEASAFSSIRWPCCRRKKAVPVVPASSPAPPPSLSIRAASK